MAEPLADQTAADAEYRRTVLPVVEQAIRDFKFWDYGLDVVDPNSEYAEWVPDLAMAIVAAVQSEEGTQ